MWLKLCNQMVIKQNVFQRMEREYMFGLIQRFLKSVNPTKVYQTIFKLTKVNPQIFKLINMKEKQQLK